MRSQSELFFFSPPFSAPPPACTENFCVFFFYRPTGDRGALQCHCLPSQCSKSDSFCFKRAAFFQGLKSKIGRSPSSPGSSPPPSFTQSPFRSLVRDGQTSPHRPRLVVSRSTCPPLTPSPCEQLCNRYCSNKHTHSLLLRRKKKNIFLYL
jgi:hypothetical protein